MASWTVTNLLNKHFSYLLKQEQYDRKDKIIDTIKGIEDDLLKTLLQKSMIYDLDKNTFVYDEKLGYAGNPPNKNLLIQDLYNNNKNRVTCKEQYYFITISLSDKIHTKKQINDFIEYCQKKIKKSYIEKYLFSIEQRSENKQYSGFHIHIYVKTNKYRSKKDVLDSYYRTFNKYIEGKNFVDIRLDNKFQQNTENYILGKKKDPDKQKKILMDSSMRKAYNIKDYYLSSWTLN